MAMQVEPGKYVAKITGHKLTESKKGTPQIAFSIDVLGRVNPADPETLDPEGAGLQRTIFRPVTDKSAEWIWQDLDRLGFTGDVFEQLDEELAAQSNVAFISLAGRDVEVKCSENFYEGKSNERWDFAMGGGGMNLQAADKSKVRELSATLGRKKVQQKSAAPAAPRPAPSGPVPF